jgi:hypothetical protein
VRAHRLSIEALPSELRPAARAIIDPQPPSALASCGLRDDQWASVAGWAAEHGLAGLLYEAIGPDVAGVPGDVLADLRAAHLADAACSLALERMTLKIAGLLDDAGVDWRLLKGGATSRLVYANPSLRRAADVDVLVRPDDFARAVAVFRGRGHQELFTPYGPADARNRKARAFVAEGVEVDVHQHVLGKLSSVGLSPDFVFSRPQQLAIGGRVVRAPSTEAMTLHAALHMTWTQTTATSLADLVRLAHRHDVDWDWAAEQLTTRGLTASVRWALGLAGGWTELPDDVRRSFGLGHPGEIGQRLVGLVSRNAMFEQLDVRLFGRQRTRRIVETLWPSADALAERGRTRRGHIRRLVGLHVAGDD